VRSLSEKNLESFMGRQKFYFWTKSRQNRSVRSPHLPVISSWYIIAVRELNSWTKVLGIYVGRRSNHWFWNRTNAVLFLYSIIKELYHKDKSVWIMFSWIEILFIFSFTKGLPCYQNNMLSLGAICRKWKAEELLNLVGSGLTIPAPTLKGYNGLVVQHPAWM
jgi:hypothetical protein